jgi:hypothetical protein
MIVIARRIDPTLLIEARAACGSLGLATEEWGGGIPRTPPRIVIAAVDPGERRIPEAVCGLLEASPGVRAILCINEPLVRPRVVLGDGRVILLGPPLDRIRLAGVLRAAVGEDVPPFAAATRFEALRRTYWVASIRGTASPALAIDEQCGVTVAIGPELALDAAARTICAARDDASHEADLAELVGSEGAVLHLTEEAGDWLIYWPRPEHPLWLCSHHRIPRCWSLAGAFAGASRKLVRIAASPGDQLVAGWAPAALPPDVFASVIEVVLEGGAVTFAAVTALVSRFATLGGVVIEAR